VKVIIITACFNSARTIGDTIRSVNLQTYPDLVHVFKDGGSRDNTVSIITSMSSRARCIISKSDNGIYDAMNKGFDAVDGDIYCFLNSDDYYADSSVVAEVVDKFITLDLDLLWGDLQYVESDNVDKVVRHWVSKPITISDVFLGLAPAHPTFFISKRALDIIGNFNLDYSLAADFDFMKRCLLIPQFKRYYLPKLMVKMRLGGATNKSFKNIILQNIQIFKSLNKHPDRFKSFPFLACKILTKARQFRS
jgi:glycosyltransferase involved in cell wall biosynthesis